MPHAVAPPPGTARAAQGRWLAEAQHDATGTDPTLPTPAVTARTVTAGVTIAIAAVVGAGVVVVTLAALRLLFSGDGRLTFGGVSTPLLAAGYVLTVAALGLGLSRYRGRRVISGRTAVVLGAAAALAVCSGLATASTHPLHRSTAVAKPRPAMSRLDLGVHAAPFAQAVATPVPTPAVTPKPAAGAASFIRDYYAALDARRFADAWASLSPAVRRAFGGFAAWRSGYAQTASSRPRELVVTSSAGVVTVRHLLLARHRGCKATQRFAVTWTLRRASGAWTVAELRGRALDAAPCR